MLDQDKAQMVQRIKRMMTLQGGKKMTFQEVTKMMLNSMDFFELRRTAARYGVTYQGIRRQKLIRDIEKKILTKAVSAAPELHPDALKAMTPMARSMSVGAVSAKPDLKDQAKELNRGMKINMFSARGVVPRARA